MKRALSEKNESLRSASPARLPAAWTRRAGPRAAPQAYRGARESLHRARLAPSCAAIIAACLLRAPGARSAPPAQKTNDEVAERRVVVEGQAYNHVGAGVADATVTVVLKDTGKTIGSATTTQYGDFSIATTGKAAGTAVVTFYKKFFKNVAVEVELGTPNGPPFVDVEMMGAIVLGGRITDALQGAPVGAATIRAEAAYKTWNSTSAEDGSFLLEGLLPGSVLLTVEAEGYARLRQRIERTEEADVHVLAVKPERIVHLRVVDETGEPIAGVNVECVDEVNNDYRHLATDQQGLVSLRGMNYESFELAVRLTHENYVSSAEFDRTIALPEAKRESTHDLVMHPAGAVGGAITSAETGKPVLGARLSVGEVLSDRSPRAWSEFDGSYRITGVPPGEVVVTVHLAGYAPQLEKITVEAGKETRLDFAMSTSRTVTGTVIGPQDEPLAGVYVTATKWRDHVTLGLRAMTDEQGRFEIVDAPLDQFEISLYAARYKPLLDLTITPGQSKYVFELEADNRAAAAGGKPGPDAGDDAPPFSVKTIDGETIDLAGLKGKVVLLDFWATWCGPCLGEIPHLLDVQKSFGQRSDFVMISISLDHDEAKLRSFVLARGMSWRHVCGTGGNAEKSADAYRVVTIPAMFLIGPDGKIVAADLRGSQVKRQLRRLLASPE